MVSKLHHNLISNPSRPTNVWPDQPFWDRSTQTFCRAEAGRGVDSDCERKRLARYRLGRPSWKKQSGERLSSWIASRYSLPHRRRDSWKITNRSIDAKESVVVIKLPKINSQRLVISNGTTKIRALKTRPTEIDVYPCSFNKTIKHISQTSLSSRSGTI